MSAVPATTRDLCVDLQVRARELRDTGTTLLAHGAMLDDADIERLDRLQRLLDEERVSSGDVGDDHDMFVRRVLTDWSGERPRQTQPEVSSEILSILDGERPRSVLEALVGREAARHIRRCQLNRMVAGSFVGVHVDQESNPDYTYALSVQLAGGFDGGEFVVHAPDGRLSYAPGYGEVLITTCRYPHEVAPVASGERRAMVCFYSFHDGPNRRVMDPPPCGEP